MEVLLSSVLVVLQLPANLRVLLEMAGAELPSVAPFPIHP
jgi:hypothetical protein